MPHTRFLFKALVLFIVLVACIPEYCYSHSHRVNYKELDTESSLSCVGTRFLEHAFPSRFITADPSLSTHFDLENSQTFNLYTYGLNNPLRYIDPTGETFWDVADVVFFSLSVAEFIAAPGWSTGINLALDTVGLAPGIPGISMVRRGADLAVSGYTMLRKTDKVGDSVKATKKAVHRPYKRKGFKEHVKESAPKTSEGQFIDPNTKQVIEGDYHFGHKYGREHRRLVKEAEAKEMTQKEFNDWINSHPEWFQIEDPVPNWSHNFEKPGS